MVAETVEEFGKLDILINNAAAYSYNNSDVPDMDLDVWYDTLDVNVSGTMLCAREAGPGTAATRRDAHPCPSARLSACFPPSAIPESYFRKPSHSSWWSPPRE